MNKLIVCLATIFLLFSKVLALSYDFSDTKSIPIKLVITEEISTKDEIYEGQRILFRVLRDVYLNKQKIIKAGEIVPARIETIITSGMNGFPAEIVVDNFEFKNIDNQKMLTTYTDKGFNRCYMVYPLKWALTLIPFAGSLTNFIKGGHAKIKTTEIVTLYYFPNWN